MKRLFVLLFMLVAGCAGVQRAPEPTTLQKVIETPSLTQEQTFNKTQKWVARYLDLQSATPSTGVIVARGEVGYPSPSIDKIQYTFVFRMKNTIVDNKDVVTFDNVMLRTPKSYIIEDEYLAKSYTGGEEVAITSPKDAAAANKALSYISDNLADYLKR
jgi:hypothetical protein